MASALESLPQEVFNHIALELEAADLAALAMASRALNRLAACDELWLEKISADFGNRTYIIDLLADSGIDLTEHLNASTDLSPWRRQQPSDDDTDEWTYTGFGLRCYRERYSRVFPASHDDSVQSTKAAESKLDEVKSMLRAGPQAGPEVFAEAAYRLILVQEYFPNSAESYYLLALMCYMLNAFKPSLEILAVGRAINAEFQPLHELMAEVSNIVSSAYGSDGEVPLLNAAGSGLSPQVTKVLAVIFQRLDRDRDGVLNSSELAQMVKITNGQPAPAPMVSQLIGAFGGQVKTKTGRKLMGWDAESLGNFFLAQTLDDPKETRADLAKFGFDPKTLKPTAM